MYNVRIIASSLACIGTLVWFGFFVQATQALNVTSFKDTISTSWPGEYSNHTLRFTLGTSMPPGAYFDFTPPPGFSITSDGTFSFRNVQMFVNGSARLSSDTLAAGIDNIDVTPGEPGNIRYILNPAAGINDGDTIEFRFGTHTSTSVNEEVIFFDGFATTTTPADAPGIQNSSSTGMHKFLMVGTGGFEPVSANFVIFLTAPVGLGPGDTTEEIPPFRFGGAPSSSISGTSQFVEISLETDEFADCSYSTTPGVEYASKPVAFNSAGLVIHSAIVVVAPGNLYTYYVRCIDDEGNFNIDDYEIIFSVNDAPTGNPNAEGEVEGDGTGTGDDGSGSGEGGGGTEGGTEGETSTVGPTTGGGGDGGGGGGGGGNRTGGEPGGGFENSGPYESGDGLVTINGFAFPGSEVFVLVDGKIAEQERAAANGSFSVEIKNIARGAYTFGIYAVDRTGIKSSTYSTSFTVAGARASALSNIILPPSIKVTPDPVPNGGTATFTGYAQPNAVVAIESRLENVNASLKTLSATADASGLWSAALPTAGFTQGTYQVRAKATPPASSATNFSQWSVYGVGQAAVVRTNADLNRDGKVNLTDFSILLFWWGTDGGNSNPPADINSDGNVSLTDFSILLFNWTG